MPSVAISCPVCGQSVALRSGGYVAKHAGQDGSPCSFTKTAHSVGSGRKAAAGAAEKADRKHAAEPSIANIAAPVPPKSTKKARPRVAAVRRECPACGLLVGESPNGELYAHKLASGRWCKDGQKATGKPRKPRRSVWATSGGLPTLGKD